MAPGRPSLAEFKSQFRGTAAIKVLQMEPMETPDRFLIELQRVNWCQDHWATSFFYGSLETEQAAGSWQVRTFKVRPEHLVFANIGGHQGWQHAGEGMAVWYARFTPPRRAEPWKEPWRLETLHYERRTATAVLRNERTNASMTIRMARIMEG